MSTKLKVLCSALLSNMYDFIVGTAHRAFCTSVLLFLIVIALHELGCVQAHTGVELQSYNYPDYYIQAADKKTGGAVSIHRQAQPHSWHIEQPGLCGVEGTASIRIGSEDSKIYIRYRHELAYAEANDNSEDFLKSACFYIHEDKFFPGHVAFESVSQPDYYLRHQNYRLKLHPYIATALFEKDASFRILDPTCKQFHSHNYPDHVIGLIGKEAYISTTPQSWIPLRPGLSGHPGSVSFRSCSNSTEYLRHSGFLLQHDPFHKTQLFRLDATFTERSRFHPGSTAFESVNYPSRFIRHYGYRLRLDEYDAAPIYKADASYYEETAESDC